VDRKQYTKQNLLDVTGIVATYTAEAMVETLKAALEAGAITVELYGQLAAEYIRRLSAQQGAIAARVEACVAIPS
jgi:hypothetical protein